MARKTWPNTKFLEKQMHLVLTPDETDVFPVAK
jgi:hypothetical protein